MAKNTTRSFIEYGEYINKKKLICLSLKTPLKDSAGNICGILETSFDLMEYNFKKVSATPLQPALLLPTIKITTKNLTKREQEFSFLLAKGMLAKEIAANMNIKPGTTDTYLSNIKTKLRCNSKSELTQKIIENIYY